MYIWQKLFIYKYQTHFFVYKLNKKLKLFNPFNSKTAEFSFYDSL